MTPTSDSDLWWEQCPEACGHPFSIPVLSLTWVTYYKPAFSSTAPYYVFSSFSSSECTYFMNLTESNWYLKHIVTNKIKTCLMIAFLISNVMPFIGQRSYSALLMYVIYINYNCTNYFLGSVTEKQRQRFASLRGYSVLHS